MHFSASRIIQPPVVEHHRLRQPLTPGERAVLEFFDHELDPAWEMYVQPHLNGLRPDFVLMNPKVGIGVFEVKDWDFDAVHYFTKRRRDGGCELWGRKDGKEFSRELDNPFTKVARYKEAIYNLYCPRLAAKNGFAVVTAGVIFPFAATDRVRMLCDPFQTAIEQKLGYNPVSGLDDLARGRLTAVFPEAARRKQSSLINEDYAADLRGWLVEPDFATTQRQPLELDANQRSLASTRTESGYRRIKGPAGSGKSLVLAARAAKLANEGKSVLIATYNITLWHYLRDLVVRGLGRPGALDEVTLTHFHGWCADVTSQASLEKEYHRLIGLLPQPGSGRGGNSVRERILGEEIPALASVAANHPDVPRYDAILVDEGQDYRPEWWNALRKCCKPGGEMLLVADATQDVYGTARRWTDEAMTGAGFPGGRWAQLDVSYRLPPDALRLARDFAARYLPGESVHLPEPDQGSLDLFPCHLRWVQCSPDDSNIHAANAVRAMMLETGEKGLANADITYLCDDANRGEPVVRGLNDNGVTAAHTFAPGTEGKRRKMAFYMGDARIKATSLHSFKGWEARLLVVHVSQAFAPEHLALVYAGLTRLKRSPEGSWLTVVCSASELAEFGRTWPDFFDHSAPIESKSNPYALTFPLIRRGESG